ncbi:DUF1573 domain-containing protein [Crocinitomix catalasitica]|nr:DUF1573 domain-containing protein [Crocinitomix catalasitica]
MKNTLLTLSIILFSAFSMNAIGQDVAVKKTNGPVIKLDKDVHDYGTIDKGADGKCVFTVSNTGNQPLIISLCKGSCGCTVPTCPKEPIAPGTSQTIEVKYDTQRVGPINKQVKITSNAVNATNFANGSGTTVVKIKGSIKDPNAATGITAPKGTAK